MVKKKKEEKKDTPEVVEKAISDEPIEVEVKKEIPAEKEEVADTDETVTIPLTEYAAQLEEIDHLNQKADEFSDGWQRERAEFANYRKRMGRDLDNQKINHKIEIIKKYLDIKDDLERAMKNIPEVCSIYCATANPTKVVIAESKQKNETGRGILGVIDGYIPKGVENKEEIAWRKKFLRDIGYKL